ncbi:phage tail protein [Salmonella enterica]|uniref:phage tail protein n=1 Tax=Salmonella enterica TaxID=28901 RepID=UPI00398C6FA1
MSCLDEGRRTKKGIVKLGSATDSDSETLAATPKAGHSVLDEVQTKTRLDSPGLPGATTERPPEPPA